MIRKLLVFATVCGSIASSSEVGRSGDQQITIQPTVQWTGGIFEWPCTSTYAIYKNSGRYINKNNIATRAQIHGNKLYVALPRYKCGIPATLAVTALDQDGCHAKLVPFPCWSMQEEGNCKAFQSVVDIFIDGNDILWALDTGVVNTLEYPIRRCPPKVVGVSLKTKKVVKTIDLSGLVCAASRLQYVVVDYAKDGRGYVYVSDAATRSIIVYDISNEKGYRVVLPRVVAANCSKRDVLYLALVRSPCGNNTLYFTYLSSDRVFSIKTEYLQRGSTQGNVQDVGVKPIKCVFLGTDGGSSIFFRYEGQSEVFRWDTKTEFKQCNFTPVYRSATCMLATHAFPDFKRGHIRVLESNFPDYIQGMVGCGAIQQVNIIRGCF